MTEKAATETKTPAASEPDSALREQCKTDLLLFAQTFFPQHCRLAFSKLHLDLIRRRQQKIAQPLEARRGQLDVVLAPRGSAKSTLVTLIFAAHAMLYGVERYIVIISATERQARQRLANLRAGLLQNPRLKERFPDLLATFVRHNARSLELGEVKVDAFSAGGEMRGISHGAWRPSWIILDDAERSDRVDNARHREALADWFAEVVDNLGDAHTHIDLVGTLLHRDALPMRLAKRPDCRFRRYPSILREAADAARWEAWRAIYNDLSSPRRVREARRFFNRHKQAMEEGAKVLWPAKEPYYDLQALREKLGRAAFDKEKQNAPWADGAAVFAAFGLRRFRLRDNVLVCDPPVGAGGAVTHATDGRPEIPLGALRLFGFLDPALGGSGAGDFAAIATVGVDGQGYCYVLDVWLGRAGPSAQVQRVFDLHERWGYERFGVETNAFQQLLLDPLEAERKRRREQGRPWMLDIAPERHGADKRTRILALEPLARNGWALFSAELSEAFMAQLLDFPTARHDDGPDAVAAAVTLARGSGKLDLLPTRLPRATGGTAKGF